MEYEGSKPVRAKKVEAEFAKMKEEKELQYNENMMAEHYESYEISDSKLRELKKELMEVVEVEEIAVKICDVLPVNKETIKTLLLSFDENIDESKVEKIYEVVKKYL